MSTEDENARRKAHSALVDFFVMYKKILGVSAVTVVLGALITLSFIGILWNPWSEGPVQAVIDPELEEIRIQAGYTTKILITLMGICGIMVIPFFGWIVWWLVTKGRKIHKELLEISSAFIHRSYVTTFELIPHQGETKIDRLFNHLSLVFPEVERIKKKIDKKSKKLSDYPKHKLQPPYTNVDQVFRTDTGDFIIKIFKTTVKWEHIEKIIKQLNIEQSMQKVFDTQVIIRVICLADKYEPFFESDDLVSKMKETKRNYYKIDLILEEKFGYSTIWIDR